MNKSEITYDIGASRRPFSSYTKSLYYKLQGQYNNITLNKPMNKKRTMTIYTDKSPLTIIISEENRNKSNNTIINIRFNNVSNNEELDDIKNNIERIFCNNIFPNINLTN